MRLGYENFKDIFWEESMHGIYPENVVSMLDFFKDEDDFLII